MAPKQALEQQRTVDDALAAYIDWREECRAVWGAYRRWFAAPRDDACNARWAYEAALDREEAAAHAYAALIGRVGRLMRAGFE